MGGVAGRIMPLPKGNYTSISVYNILDMVRHDNCLWIARKSQLVDVTPSKENSDSWMQVTELSDIDVIRNNIRELMTSVDAAEVNIDTLTAELNVLKERVESGGQQGSVVVIGDTEPSECNVLWFDTSQSTATESGETTENTTETN